MTNLTIIIIMKNNSEECQLSIDSVRKFKGDYDINVVVLDACSEFGHSHYIMNNDDITYILFEQGEAVFSKMINATISELDIRNDFMILDSGLELNSTTLKEIELLLRETENIGTIAPFFECSNYYPILKCGIPKDVTYIDTMVTSCCSVYITYKLWKKLGGFDENIGSPEIALEDFQLLALKNGMRNILSFTSNVSIIGERLCLRQKDFSYSTDNSVIEEKWGMYYFSTYPNYNLINMIPFSKNDAINVLEIGCDCGATLLNIKNCYINSTIYGIELNPASASIACNFSKTVVANIETDEFPFENVLFDIIIFGDVLEHLSNPKNTILKCKKYLKNHGYILCSIPNVQHISVVYPLLHGRFTYKKMGLLDETHIHLFTGIEIYNMFQECGFEIENIGSTTVTIDSESEDAIRKIKEIFPDVNETLFLVYQYLVCAKNLV